METVDARGLACPGPVLETKKFIEKKNPDSLNVIVDNDAARQNVERFLASQGFNSQSSQQGNDFAVTGVKEGGDSCGICSVPEKSGGATTMVVITSDRLGRGDDMLGRKLTANFIKTLREMGDELWRLVFLNSGVKLATDGSDVLEDLKEYERNGLHILVCGTCLTHFNLLDKKRVGETTNMLDIVTAMQMAGKVIVL